MGKTVDKIPIKDSKIQNTEIAWLPSLGLIYLCDPKLMMSAWKLWAISGFYKLKRKKT